MRKWISNWRRRREYLRLQHKIQTCGLYSIDQYGIVLPSIGIQTIFPEDVLLIKLSTSMLIEEAVGDSVVAALNYAASVPPVPTPTDYSIGAAKFHEGMEQFRKSVNIGKRRFERDLELVSIVRKSGMISFLKMSSVHGKYAFEGTKLPQGQLSIEATASSYKIGKAVQSLRPNWEKNG